MRYLSKFLHIHINGFGISLLYKTDLEHTIRDKNIKLALVHLLFPRKNVSSSPAVLESVPTKKDAILRWYVLSVAARKGTVYSI